MSGMSAPQPTEGPTEQRPGVRHFEWWHHSHPTFAALAGFFAGMLFVTAVPGAFAGILRLVFTYDRAEELFPWVAVALVVPLALLAKRKTRRFGTYMVIGMAITALVVLGVASLVLYFMVRYDA
jgi:4-amino-4-deoxy-L-arabinose transferase-like glycosyltransferase